MFDPAGDDDVRDVLIRAFRSGTDEHHCHVRHELRERFDPVYAFLPHESTHEQDDPGVRWQAQFPPQLSGIFPWHMTECSRIDTVEDAAGVARFLSVEEPEDVVADEHDSIHQTKKNGAEYTSANLIQSSK